MEPLYKGHVGIIILVLITEVSSIQRLFNTLQYYTGTQNGVPIIDVPTFQRVCNREVPMYLLSKLDCIVCSVHMLYMH